MKSGKTGLIIQALVCLAIIVWQVHDFIVAKSAPPLTMALFDAVVVIFGVIGLAGAVYGLRRPSSSRA